MSQTRILVVDDDRDVRETMADLLADEGYEVSVAEHGQQALEALRDAPLPNIILLDLMMPVLDGYAFRARQLADARFANIPVIGMTASGSEDQRIHELRADGFLRKPFEFPALLGLIEHLVSR